MDNVHKWNFYLIVPMTAGQILLRFPSGSVCCGHGGQLTTVREHDATIQETARSAAHVQDQPAHVLF